MADGSSSTQGISISLKNPPVDNKNSNGNEGYDTTDAVPTSGTLSSKHSSKFDYDFTHSKRGVCIIFNNMQFDEETHQKPREGSEKDADNIQTTFKNLGFEVNPSEDNTCLEMYNTLLEESKKDHKDEDCFVCVILSHGESALIQGEYGERDIIADVIYGKDNIIALKDLTDLMNNENCPSLIGKPKIFISQACRGVKLSESVEFMQTVNQSGEKYVTPTAAQLQKPPPEQLPVEIGYDTTDSIAYGFPIDAPIDKDFILVCSSPPGFYSFRNPMKGSIFIQAICDKLNRLYKHLDFLTILTRVNHQVAYEYTSHAPSSPFYHQKKQMPWVASRLTSCINFSPKHNKILQETFLQLSIK